jgi:CHAD domain-containing protein
MAPSASQYILQDGVTPETLRASLQPRFGLESEPGEAVDRAYYDTFDGRVRGAGLALVWEAARFVLVDGEDREVAAADWARSPEHVRAGDLPAGELHDRLLAVFGVRAAAPLVRLRVRRRRLRLLDAERKTVARLVIEEPSVVLGSHRHVRLPARLSLAGLRGYTKALERTQRVVEGELELPAVSESLADEAVRRSGGTPGGVSSKVEVALDPAHRADSAAAAILTRLTTVVEANLPGTLADRDSEFLHDLRVAVRRTRSLQRELSGVFPPGELTRFRGEFRRLQGVTGPSRDLDVYLLELVGFADSLPEAQQHDLEPLRALLVEHRGRERRKMVRALRSQRTRTLLADWKRLLDRLEDLPEDERPDAARPIREIAARRVATVSRQMVRSGERIDEQSPPVALHDLRKKGKELRYLLEFFAPLFPEQTVQPMVRTLKALQDSLGRFQDREIQAATLRSFGEQIASQEDGPAALMAMGMLVERLERQQADARAEFAQRFAPFAAERRRSKEAFR